VAAFVVLTFVVSWGLWVPTLLSLSPDAVGPLHVAPGAFGPVVAAAVIAYGRDEADDWLDRVRRVRVAPRWYAAALATPLALGAAVVALAGAFGATLTLDRFARTVPTYPVSLLLLSLVGGGQEELGWRGFALPRLQARYGALAASVALGVVWAGWHLPLFVLQSGIYSHQSFLLYAPLVVALSVLMTWAFNGSGGSVPVAVLLHGGVNAVQGVAFAGVALATLPTSPLALVLLVALAAALAVTAVHGPATLAPAEAVRSHHPNSASNTDPVSEVSA
jgi:membrane protease YdiL (CAAX protease family)